MNEPFIFLLTENFNMLPVQLVNLGNYLRPRDCFDFLTKNDLRFVHKNMSPWQESAMNLWWICNLFLMMKRQKQSICIPPSPIVNFLLLCTTTLVCSTVLKPWRYHWLDLLSKYQASKSTHISHSSKLTSKEHKRTKPIFTQYKSNHHHPTWHRSLN